MTESWIDSLDRQQATLAAYRITSLICCCWRNKIILFFCINKMFFGYPYFFLIPNSFLIIPNGLPEWLNLHLAEPKHISWVGWRLNCILSTLSGFGFDASISNMVFFQPVCCVPLSGSSCIVYIERKEEFHFLFRKWLKLWGCILWAAWNDNIPFHDLSIYFTWVEQTATLYII